MDEKEKNKKGSQGTGFSFCILDEQYFPCQAVYCLINDIYITSLEPDGKNLPS